MMAGVGHIEVAHVDYYLPDGRMLLSDASFRVGQGAVVALVGPNGAGKSTLARLITGELEPEVGTVTTSGGVGVMPQFVGSVRDDRTVRDLLVSVARKGIRDAARAVDDAELAIMERDDEKAQMAYAQALSDWGDAGGYEAETIWDMCTMAALAVPYEKAQWRQVTVRRENAPGIAGRCAEPLIGAVHECSFSRRASAAIARDVVDLTVPWLMPIAVAMSGSGKSMK